MSKKLQKIGILLVLTLVFGVFLFGAKTEAAACSVKNALGSVSYNVTINQPGDYKIWARLRPEGKSADTLYMEIDGNACLVVGADDSLAAKTWVWVDYGGQGNDKKKLLHTFESTGNHSIKVIASQTGVGIDRLLLLAASDTCTPSNKQEGDIQPGDNCKSDATITQENTAAPAESGKPLMSTGKKILLSLLLLLIVSLLGFVGFKWWRNNKFKKSSSAKEPPIVIHK